MKPEIYLEAALTELFVAPEDAPESLAVRLQYTETAAAGMGWVFDLLADGKCVLSAGLRATEGMFLSLYLLAVIGRTPRFTVSPTLAQASQTKMMTRLYSHEGGTNGAGCLWVEDGRLWVGYAYAGQMVAGAALDEAQVAGLARLADAMDRVY